MNCRVFGTAPDSSTVMALYLGYRTIFIPYYTGKPGVGQRKFVEGRNLRSQFEVALECKAGTGESRYVLSRTNHLNNSYVVVYDRNMNLLILTNAH